MELWSTSGGTFGRSGIEGFFNRRIYNLDKWQCYARMTYNVFYHQLMVWNEHREVLFQDCIWSTSFFEKTWNTKHKIAYLCFFLSLYQRWIWAHFRSKNRGKPKQRSMVFYIDAQDTSRTDKTRNKLNQTTETINSLHLSWRTQQIHIKRPDTNKQISTLAYYICH